MPEELVIWAAGGRLAMAAGDVRSGETIVEFLLHIIR